MPRMTPEERFWSKVDRGGGPSDCWRWVGPRDRHGYGKFYLDGRSRIAHRVAWELITGSPPPAGKVLAHQCDQRDCMRHLFVATQAENVADCKAKSRQARGVRFPQARLNDESVRRVWELRREGISQVEIAKRVGASKTAVHLVLSGRTWKHVAPASERAA